MRFAIRLKSSFISFVRALQPSTPAGRLVVINHAPVGSNDLIVGVSSTSA